MWRTTKFSLSTQGKLIIQEIPSKVARSVDWTSLGKSSLRMSHPFSPRPWHANLWLGQRCIRQRRGSPMGSPLSPALCLMVVSISEQIWSINFKQILSNHHPFIKHIRYVDNQLIFGDARLQQLPPYEVLLDEGFYGTPIILETQPDQEFLGFMLETKPLELIYHGPTNISQVLSPYPASPPKVLLSGFRSRCHIVDQGCFSRSPSPTRPGSIDPLVHFCWFSQWGTPHHFITDLEPSSEPSAARENVLSASIRASDVWLVLFPLVVSFALLFGPALVLPVSFWLKLVYPTSRLTPLTPLTIMDSPHGREIHYHLARALIFEQYRRFSSLFRTCCRLGWPPQWSIWPFHSYPSTSQATTYLRAFAFLFVHSYSFITCRATDSYGPEPRTSAATSFHSSRNQHHWRPSLYRQARSNGITIVCQCRRAHFRTSCQSCRSCSPSLTSYHWIYSAKSQRISKRRRSSQKETSCHRHNHFLDYSHHSPNLGDIPPEGFNYDNSDDGTRRRHSPSNPRPISPPPVNPSASVNDPPRPPTVEDHSTPAVAKSGTTATPAVTPVVPPRSSVHSNIRPYGCRRSRTFHIQKRHQVTTIMEDNRPPVETRSRSMQYPMANPEANHARDEPPHRTGSGNWGLNHQQSQKVFPVRSPATQLFLSVLVH